MNISWTKAERKYQYWYGNTDSSFSFQIGEGAPKPMLTWMVFHSDFTGSFHGGQAETIEDAQAA